MQSSHSHADQSSLTSLTCLAATLPVSWLFGQAAVTIIMVLDFINCFPKSDPQVMQMGELEHLGL